MSRSMGTATATRPTVIPAPRRPAGVETAPEQTDTAPRRELPAARYPWPEPWGSYRGARSRTEFWNEATGTWHSRGPVSR